MADAVQHAINDSRRVPNMVLTAHVHNYQRIEKELVKSGPTPFLVVGGGGYYHMHDMNADPGVSDLDTGAKLMASEYKRHAYVILTADNKTISGTLITADPGDENPTRDVDTFSYSASLLTLPDDATVSL